ncbi:DEAD/DEAH box helicase [Candidatus Dojkabacteria bacterium]|jgi:SNF2 family DNA or RNA helicase|nr:DEAD/DEAH box helicase [Candidatus Dojkabacteria bacterium]
MNLPLRNYQQQAVDFILRTGSALLADDVGTGKTLTSIAVSEARNAQRVLVVCPSSLKYSWEAEIKKWLPSASISVVNGSRSSRVLAYGIKFHNNNPRFTIVNYELLLKDIELYAEVWDFVVFDEGTRLVNPQAKTAKLAKKIPHKYLLIITGTPITNRPENIWNIIDTIKPNALGNYYQFINRYCLKGDYHNIIAYKKLEELSERIKPYYIRRTKEQVLIDLPPIVETDIIVELSLEERKLYNAVKRQLFHELLGPETSKINLSSIQSVLTRMIRLKQVADGMELIGDVSKSSKIEALLDLLEELNGQKVIVFSQFAEMCKIILRDLVDYNPLIIIGDTPTSERFNIIESFNSIENTVNKVLIMSEAGSEGLNIQNDCSYVVHFDSAWSLSKMTQRTGRVHRSGQKNTVFSYSFTAKDTIDEYVKKVLMKKDALSRQVITISDIEAILS